MGIVVIDGGSAAIPAPVRIGVVTVVVPSSADGVAASSVPEVIAA